MFFESWVSLGRTLVVGIAAYFALIVIVRVSGKRTLAKMNAFDLVVTVALGSTLSAILTSRQTPLADGLLALVLLVVLQFIVAWVTVRWPRAERLVKSDPTVLVLRGRLDRAALLRQRVAEAEVRAAMRQSGIARLEDVGVLMLETDGTFTTVPSDALGPLSPPLSRAVAVPEP